MKSSLYNFCTNHMLPLTATWQRDDFNSDRYFISLWLLTCDSCLHQRAQLQSYMRPLFLQSECSLFFVGRGGGHLLPTGCWSIRRRSSLLTSPFSDPSICLHCGSSQQSMCCFHFIFIFRHCCTDTQRRFQTGRGSDSFCWLVMDALVQTHICVKQTFGI